MQRALAEGEAQGGHVLGLAGEADVPAAGRLLELDRLHDGVLVDQVVGPGGHDGLGRVELLGVERRQHATGARATTSP
ncbi:MAG: hypothetical protein AAGK32_04335 [Actinomycetota bacterium]